MPRPPRTKIKLTTDSIEQELQEIKNQMEELRIKANKDYMKVTQMMDTSEDIQVLENSRNNSIRAIRDYLVMRKDLVNIQRAAKADLDKVGPTEAGTPDADGNPAAGQNVIGVDWKLQMQEMRNQFKKDKENQKPSE